MLQPQTEKLMKKKLMTLISRRLAEIESAMNLKSA